MRRVATFGFLLSFLLPGSPVHGAEPALQIPADLRVSELSGKVSRLDFTASKLTLVNFWATWCMPCREEMPEIVKLLKKHGNGGFRAVGIALESGEPADIKAFLEENKSLGITYPIYVGDDAVSEAFGGIEMVPTTYLVNQRGQVVKRYLGVNERFAERVGAEIKKALASESAPSGGSP